METVFLHLPGTCLSILPNDKARIFAAALLGLPIPILDEEKKLT